MTTDRSNLSRLLPIAGIVGPVSAVLIARAMLSIGPNEAPAAEVQDQHALGAAPIVVPARVTDAQRAALAYFPQLPAAGNVRSPMMAPIVDERPEPVPERQAEKLDDPSRMLVLNSVVGKGDRALASIDNRIYRVGEEPMPGWTILVINAADRTVLLRHSSGTEAILSYHVENQGP